MRAVIVQNFLISNDNFADQKIVCGYYILIRHGGHLHNDEVAISRLEEVGLPLHQDLHLVLHPVDLKDIGKSFSNDFQPISTSAYHQRVEIIRRASAGYQHYQHQQSYHHWSHPWPWLPIGWVAT